MSTNSISLIMPVFNAEKYLHATLNSIFDQTFRNFELIVIDDGSTDNSLKIIKSFDDSRIKLIINELNLGLAKSLNIGIRKASGQYIARMDADDICLSNRLQKQYNYLQENKDVAILGGAIQHIGYSKKKVVYPLSADQVRSRLLFDCPIAHPTVVMRKEVLVNNQYFYDETCKGAQDSEDYKLWVEISKKFKIENLPDILLHYRTYSPRDYTKRYALQNSANAIRTSLINELMPDVTIDELGLHHKICTYQFDESIQFIENSHDWFLKLLHKNRNTLDYNPSCLKKELVERWWLICKSASKHGNKVWKLYRQSPLFSSVDINTKRHFLLWIRCQLRYSRNQDQWINRIKIHIENYYK